MRLTINNIKICENLRHPCHPRSFEAALLYMLVYLKQK